MATQKLTSSTDRALWMIALSLAIIATCLVLLVIRQHAPLQETTAPLPSPRVEIKSEPDLPKHIPAIARPKSSHPAISDLDSPPAQLPKPVEVAPSTTPEPPLVPVVAKESFSSTGLAPLTFLKTNNSTLITGRVTLKGTPPPEARIELDAVCGKLHKTPITTHRYVVSTNGGLANVFVYIKGSLARHSFPVPAEPAVLNQIGCEFQPIVLGLMTQQRLHISNSDPLFHNVDATPRNFGNVAFNLGQASGASVNRQFNSPEIPIRIKCDVHPWMFAYACVVDHPFFAVTDSDGAFTITNAPPGTYELAALHPQSRIEATQKITVENGAATTADFEIEAINKMARK